MIALLFTIMALLTPQQKYERMLFGQLARQDLVAFARVTSPDSREPLNVRRSRFDVAPHHEFTARMLEGLSRREFLRGRVDMPYRHGKTELGVRKFVPWLLGNYPDQNGMVITHTASLADEHGSDVRDVMRSDGYKLTFGHDPRTALREDSQARERLKVNGGGTVYFYGRDKMGGGYGADWIIIDDLIKNAIEANSKTIRDKAWKVYNSDCLSRLNSDTGWLLLIGTRRHADDPPGRIFDPRNSHFDARIVEQFRVVKLPALSMGPDVDQLGRAKDVPLWPEKRSFAFWNGLRTSPDETVREDFETQAQCNPRPPEGRFFKAHWWQGREASEGKPATPKTTYASADELPKRLRYYAASDHAVTEDQRNDQTVLLPFGLDERCHLWVLPEAMAFRYESTDTVEAMLQIMKRFRPMQWAAEREHISKSILPFLRRRQIEERIFGYIEESSAAAHPEVRAWSIRGMMASGRVHLPTYAPWWEEMESQLLEFPGGEHDDWISALAHAGMLLDRVLAAEGGNQRNQPQPGTMAHFQQQKERGLTAGNLKGWS